MDFYNILKEIFEYLKKQAQNINSFLMKIRMKSKSQIENPKLNYF